MMRKIFAFLLAATMLFSLTACDTAELLELADVVLETVDEVLDEQTTTEETEQETVSSADTEDVIQTEPSAITPVPDVTEETVSEDGVYSSKEDVSRYLFLYGHLPGNYVTKQQARAEGWDSSSGNLWDVLPGKSIGGDSFGNYEKLLPDAAGRKWYECDIDYEGGYRGAKRIVYSNDGLIYYTEDHYETFELLYEK